MPTRRACPEGEFAQRIRVEGLVLSEEPLERFRVEGLAVDSPTQLRRGAFSLASSS
jgi:hypothetical protein